MDNVEGQAETHLETPDPSDKPSGPELTFKGKALKQEEIPDVLKQAEHLESLRGTLGTRIEQQAKENAELKERLARVEGKQEAEQKPPEEGQKFLDTLLDDPDRAYAQVKAAAKEEAMAEMKKEMEAFRGEVSQTVNAQNVVSNFFDQYPDLRKYEREFIGGKSIVEHAKNELLARSQTDNILAMQINDKNQAFKLLADETQKLAKRLNLISTDEKPTNRDLAERGSKQVPFGMPAKVCPESNYTAEDMRKEMLEAHRKLRQRIRPANMAKD